MPSLPKSIVISRAMHSIASEIPCFVGYRFEKTAVQAVFILLTAATGVCEAKKAGVNVDLNGRQSRDDQGASSEATDSPMGHQQKYRETHRRVFLCFFLRKRKGGIEESGNE